MKYYIEVHGQVVRQLNGGAGPAVCEVEKLRELSRVCDEGELDGALKEVVGKARDRARVIKIFTHDGLNNSSSIKKFSEIVLPGV